MEVYYGGSDTLIVSNEQEAIEYGLAAGLDFLDKYQDGFINYSKTLSTKQKLMDAFTYVFQAYVKETPYRPDTVVAVEARLTEKIDVEWKGQRLTLPVPLKGALDRIDREDGKIRIVDYKTCYAFSNPEKIDGQKIIQAVTYYLLAYAHLGEAPYSVIFEETKYTRNSDGSPQVRRYEIVYEEHDLFFDFYFRLYEDVTRALNGEMVYVPNVQALFDNEIALIAYIHRLDMAEERAALMKKHKVQNITDLLRKEIQSAGNMRKLMKAVEEQMVEAKSINYEKMSNEDKIKTKLMEHGMILTFDSVVNGATVDQYRFAPSIGIKMSRLSGYVQDIEQVLGVSGVRVLAPIANTSLIGFEVPRKERTFPALPATGPTFQIAIGETIMGEERRFDIRTAPHMLVAGSSGSGKSVFLNTVIKQLQPLGDLHLFDPKIVELARFADAATEYLTDADAINRALAALVVEMETRYKALAKMGAKNIEGTAIRYKFVVIDEFGDLAAQNPEGEEKWELCQKHGTWNENNDFLLTQLLASKRRLRVKQQELVDQVVFCSECRKTTIPPFEQSLLRLAAKGRAAGIHLIIATQRPSVDVISGTIKANFPTKAVFRTAKATDSQVVLDEPGAEKLKGMGDMLFAGDQGIERLQGYN